MCRLALGAGLLAAAAVSVAVFVPRRRLAFVTEPLADLAKLPVAAAVTAWAVGLWQRRHRAPGAGVRRPAPL